MIESAESTVEFRASIPPGAAPLETILRTEELRIRPSRPPDHQGENSALAALVGTLADSPHCILQTLADKVLEVLRADSAGLSLLTKDEDRFYWAAISGAWRPHVGGGTPRDFSPCGDVLDRNIPMLFTHWERRYPYLSTAIPLAEEGLLVPFHVNGKVVGTIWAIAHTNRRKFDTEDLRLLESLGRFASAAYQTVESIESLRSEIAAREQVETRVRQMANSLEAKIRRLVDSNIIGIFIWTADGGIVDANDAFLRILGYSHQDLAAGELNWKKLTPPEWRAVDQRRVLEFQCTGSAHPYEKEYFHRDGSRVPVLVGAAKFEEAKDQGVAFVLDLTELKRVEKEARESDERCSEMQTELARANRVATMGQLSASIAHEINQPLAGIVAKANAALRWLVADPADIDKVRSLLSDIVNAGHRASDIITSVRTMFQKDTKERSSIDVNDLISTVLQIVRVDCQRGGVDIRAQLEEGLPAIEADKVQLQQVVLNLIVNSIESMHSVQARVLTVRSTRSKPDALRVSVEDTGAGIDASHADSVFKPLFTTKTHGTGMGLAICRSIIETHGGRIWVSPGTERGSIFQFELPLNGGA